MQFPAAAKVMRVPEEVIRLNNLSFRFPDCSKAVLHNVSAIIHRGERIAVCGPSGCGKSTLLYLLNRLYPLNCDGIVSGEIRLFGKNGEHYAPGEINRRIATVFQDPDAQFCMPTVEEELAFTLENLHIPQADMEERIAGILSLTSLTEWRHSKIHSLSGGMKQRVAVACALIMDPEVLLLDEPLSHLDPVTARDFVCWLDRLQQLRQLTIIAVEHRLVHWKSFFKREIRLGKDGRVIADGPPAEIPALLFPSRLSGKAAEEALRIQGLAVEIDGKTRLSPLSFSLTRGEVTIVAGPNGSGKTTLLKALCGIHQASGTIQAISRRGYVPQSPEFMFLTQSVSQEVAYSGISSLQEIKGLMNRLDLSTIADSHPFSVSHGQKRRVAVGAMLADKRQILLMDEPTAGQDAASLQELYTLIGQRTAEGAAFVIVTHDMSFALAVADSVVLLKDGAMTGKYSAADFWTRDDLLLAHHLLAPEGVAIHEASIE